MEEVQKEWKKSSRATQEAEMKFEHSCVFSLTLLLIITANIYGCTMYQHNFCMALPLLRTVRVQKPAPHLPKSDLRKRGICIQGFRSCYNLYHSICTTLDLVLLFKRVLYKLQVPQNLTRVAGSFTFYLCTFLCPWGFIEAAGPHSAELDSILTLKGTW